MADDNTFFFKLLLFLITIGVFISLFGGSPMPVAPGFSVANTTPTAPAFCTDPDFLAAIVCLVISIVIFIIWVVASVIFMILSLVSMAAWLTGVSVLLTGAHGTALLPDPFNMLAAFLLGIAWLYCVALFVKRLREMQW